MMIIRTSQKKPRHNNANSNRGTFDYNQQHRKAIMPSSSNGQTTRTRSDCYKKTWRVLGYCCLKFRAFYEKFGLRHVTPFLLLVAYSFLGAAIFQFVEADHESEREREKMRKYDMLRRTAAWNLTEILKSRIMRNETKRMQTHDFIFWYEQQLGLHNASALRWDIWGALFYVGTIYTTIGYGNITPATTAGRLLTVFYALFGIPLVLAILNDLGQLMRRWINTGWSRTTTLVARLKLSLRFGRRPNRMQEIVGSANEDFFGGKPKSETENPDDNCADDPPAIPVSIALLLTLGWVLLCSGLFCLWETNWTYGTSLYFFFISLSTIGFGDITPDHPHYMIANFFLVIIGLCLVSMTLGVIQQRIEAFLYRMMKLLRDEYAAAVEDCVDDSRRRPSHLLASAWMKQSWYARMFGPALMSRDAQRRLNVCAVRVAGGQNFSTIVRDLMVLKRDSDYDVSDDPRKLDEHCENGLMKMQAQGRPATAVSYNSSICCHYRSHSSVHKKSTDALCAPTVLLCDNSTQTERIPAFLSIFDEEEHTLIRRYSSPYVGVTSAQLSLAPCKKDAEAQVCIYAQQKHAYAQFDAQEICAEEKDKKKKGKKGQKLKMSSKSVKIAEPIEKKLKEQIVQTDDSYLKLASKLEALRTNRADSLAIMVTPKVKKPKSEKK